MILGPAYSWLSCDSPGSQPFGLHGLPLRNKKTFTVEDLKIKD
jgi:hypothetical protein